MPIHHSAAVGFDRAGEAYEPGRPSYPLDAVSFLEQALGIGPTSRIVDLAAGTGKLTRLLATSGADVTAVEPVAGMRYKLAQSLPQVCALDGMAEVIPLADGSADAVVVGQAFHWFDGPRALAEIHRVLAPGGRLGLIWNARDVSVDWVARLGEIVNAYEGDTPRYASGEWRIAFQQTSLFTPLEERHFQHVQYGDAEMVRARAASVSFIAALTDDVRRDVLNAVTELLRSHPQTRGREEFAISYGTDVYWCARL